MWIEGQEEVRVTKLSLAFSQCHSSGHHTGPDLSWKQRVMVRWSDTFGGPPPAHLSTTLSRCHSIGLSEALLTLLGASWKKIAAMAAPIAVALEGEEERGKKLLHTILFISKGRGSGVQPPLWLPFSFTRRVCMCRRAISGAFRQSGDTCHPYHHSLVARTSPNLGGSS